MDEVFLRNVNCFNRNCQRVTRWQLRSDRCAGKGSGKMKNIAEEREGESVGEKDTQSEGW